MGIWDELERDELERDELEQDKQYFVKSDMHVSTACIRRQ